MSHYDVLGVGKNATSQEIKKAYRRKAQKIAPRTDKECDDPERSKALVALNKAHDCLSDPAKREYYDLHGDEKKPSSIEQQALQVIYGILMALSDKDEGETDFVASVVQNLKNNIDNLSRQEPMVKKKIAKAEKHRKCIRHKKGEENLLDRVFEQKIAALSARLAELPEAMEIGKKALEIMNDYESTAQDFRGNSIEQSALFNALMGNAELFARGNRWK